MKADPIFRPVIEGFVTCVGLKKDLRKDPIIIVLTKETSSFDLR